jgi:hypothetical protein
MHYMIMDSELRYNYELKKFLHSLSYMICTKHSCANWNTIFGVKCNTDETIEYCQYLHILDENACEKYQIQMRRARS